MKTRLYTRVSRSVPRAKSHSHPHLSSSGFTPSTPPRDPQPTLIGPDHTQPGPRGLSQSHPKSQPKPWSECTPKALGCEHCNMLMGSLQRRVVENWLVFERSL